MMIAYIESTLHDRRDQEREGNHLTENVHTSSQRQRKYIKSKENKKI